MSLLTFHPWRHLRNARDRDGMDGAELMILDVGLAVRVITGIRSHTAMSTGCLEWEAEGVRAALTKTEGSPGAVLAAACLAAEDSSLRMPSAAAFAHHWPVNAKTEAPAPRNIVRCAVHHEALPCLACKAEAGPELTPEQRVERAAQIRADIDKAIRDSATERHAIHERQKEANQ